MNLYILRHGIAEDLAPGKGGRDADRALTPKGRRNTKRTAASLLDLAVKFDLILTSPLKRAHQTAEIVASQMDCRKRLDVCEHLAPGVDASKLIKAVAELSPPPENLLLVGHEPDLSQLVARLVFGNPTDAVTLKKGGLCKLHVEKLKAGRCARLEWLLTPKHFELME